MKFLAYVRNDITVGKSKLRPTGKKITFTATKHGYRNDILVLEEMSPNWYIHGSSKNIFHKGWLKGISAFEDNIYVAQHENVFRIVIYQLDSERVVDVDSNDELDVSTFLQYYSNLDQTSVTHYKNEASFNNKCSKCKKDITIVTMKQFDNKVFCATCYEKMFAECPKCKTYFKKSDLTKKGTKFFCSKCVDSIKQCSICKEYFDESTIITKNGKRMCNECKAKFYRACRDCNREFYIEEQPLKIYPDSSHTELCPACFHARQERAIQCYTYKPEPLFNGHKGCGKLFLGIEIEMACNNNPENTARYIRDEVNKKNGKELVYCKSDTSIDGGGFEVVTHPMNWLWLKKHHKIFSYMFSVAEGYGCKAGKGESSCGVHIHLSRDAFTQTRLLKFTHFIYQNQEFIYKISGRTNKKQFEQFASFDRISPKDFIKIIKSKQPSGHNKHSALAFSSPDTIEVRIFNGTLQEDRLYKDMEFCVALHKFTEEHSFKQMVKKEFMAYVRENRKEYVNLYNFLN